jgi:hypothetical protein
MAPLLPAVRRIDVTLHPAERVSLAMMAGRNRRGRSGDWTETFAGLLELTVPSEIQSSKIGGRYRFKKSLLDSWLGKRPEGEDVSGRNRLVGKVSAIKRDVILAQVNLDVGDQKGRRSSRATRLIRWDCKSAIMWWR